MKETFFRLRNTLAVSLSMALLWSTASMAANITNTATGTIGGIANTLTPGPVTLDVQKLGVMKKVYDLDKRDVMVAGGKVASGQELYILMYVDNVTAAQINDIRIQDNLDDSDGNGAAGDSAGFTFIPGSVELLTSVVATTAASGDSALAPGWFHTGTWTAKTDAADGDEASANVAAGNTKAVISMGQAANPQFNLMPSRIHAIRFRVTITPI